MLTTQSKNESVIVIHSACDFYFAHKFQLHLLYMDICQIISMNLATLHEFLHVYSYELYSGLGIWVACSTPYPCIMVDMAGVNYS